MPAMNVTRFHVVGFTAFQKLEHLTFEGPSVLDTAPMSVLNYRRTYRKAEKAYMDMRKRHVTVAILAQSHRTTSLPIKVNEGSKTEPYVLARKIGLPTQGDTEYHTKRKLRA